MAISLLRIEDFRNLASVSLESCSHGLNIICGDNGSGKTSLLEAIHYLGLGRSFRSSSPNRLIRHKIDKFSLFAQLVSDGSQHIPVGVSREANGTVRLRVSEKDVSSIAEIVTYLPIRIINSHSHHLFESGPIYRRKYLDWGLFYQFENFLPCWRHFERALKQRNVILRDRRPKSELTVWTNELIRYGRELDSLRREYLLLLAPFVAEAAETLLGISSLELIYQPGWEESRNLTDVLAESFYDEMRIGHTQFGPHRADLDIRVDGLSVKHFLSRGQQKLLICAMILGQGMTLAKHANKGLIYLVDDLPSELDLQSRQKLISLLSKQKTQIFITAIEQEAIFDVLMEKPEVPMKVFHVEHGKVVVRAD